MNIYWFKLVFQFLYLWYKSCLKFGCVCIGSILHGNLNAWSWLYIHLLVIHLEPTKTGHPPWYVNMFPLQSVLMLTQKIADPFLAIALIPNNGNVVSPPASISLRYAIKVANLKNGTFWRQLLTDWKTGWRRGQSGFVWRSTDCCPSTLSVPRVHVFLYLHVSSGSQTIETSATQGTFRNARTTPIRSIIWHLRKNISLEILLFVILESSSTTDTCTLLLAKMRLQMHSPRKTRWPMTTMPRQLMWTTGIGMNLWRAHAPAHTFLP